MIEYSQNEFLHCKGVMVKTTIELYLIFQKEIRCRVTERRKCSFPLQNEVVRRCSIKKFAKLTGKETHVMVFFLINVLTQPYACKFTKKGSSPRFSYEF